MTDRGEGSIASLPKVLCWLLSMPGWNGDKRHLILCGHRHFSGSSTPLQRAGCLIFNVTPNLLLMNYSLYASLLFGCQTWCAINCYCSWTFPATMDCAYWRLPITNRTPKKFFAQVSFVRKSFPLSDAVESQRHSRTARLSTNSWKNVRGSPSLNLWCTQRRPVHVTEVLLRCRSHSSKKTTVSLCSVSTPLTAPTNVISAPQISLRNLNTKKKPFFLCIMILHHAVKT